MKRLASPLKTSKSPQFLKKLARLLMASTLFCGSGLYGEDMDEGQRVMEVSVLPSDPGSQLQDFSGSFPNLQVLDFFVNAKRLLLDLSGDLPNLGSLNIHSTKGNIKVRFQGNYPSLEAINVETSEGNIYLDLRGDWFRDCDLAVQSDSGNIVLQIPEQVPVRVYPTTEDGKANMGPLEKVDSWFFQSYFSNEKQEDLKENGSLEVRVESKTGKLTIKT